jgi:hypothetical protein
VRHVLLCTVSRGGELLVIRCWLSVASGGKQGRSADN